MSVSPVPSGYHSVTPYLIVDGADAAIRFYVDALGATEVMRLPMGDKIGHAEIRIGDSHIMLADEFPEMDAIGPAKRGGTSVSLMIYVADVDAVFARAIKAGARESSAGRRQILRRPFRHDLRSVRPLLDDRHPRRGCRARRNTAADGCAGARAGVTGKRPAE